MIFKKPLQSKWRQRKKAIQFILRASVVTISIFLISGMTIDLLPFFLHEKTLSARLVNTAPSTEPISQKPITKRRTFQAAKKVLSEVYQGRKTEFYCGCHYHDKQVDWSSCGYIPRRRSTRATRIEWEHVMPAWNLGHQRQCWQKAKTEGRSSRQACRKKDAVFAFAEGDLVNLVPAIGEINADRQNFRYAEWTAHPLPMYGRCETIVDFKNRRIQPRPAVRGQVARIQLYMA